MVSGTMPNSCSRKCLTRFDDLPGWQALPWVEGAIQDSQMPCTSSPSCTWGSLLHCVLLSSITRVRAFEVCQAICSMYLVLVLVYNEGCLLLWSVSTCVLCTRIGCFGGIYHSSLLFDCFRIVAKCIEEAVQQFQVEKASHLLRMTVI
jgi:hypothetical protein